MRSSPAVMLLPLVALIGAFTLGPVNQALAQTVSAIFLPVAWPAHTVGQALVTRLLPARVPDPLSPDSPRSIDQLRQQNAILLNELAGQRRVNDALKEELARYTNVDTDLKRVIGWATVIQKPSDTRQYLSVSTARLSSVRENALVLAPAGVVGAISGVPPTGGTARVLLTIDPASHLLCQFVRFTRTTDGAMNVVSLGLDQPVLDGTGRGLIARHLKPRPVREKLQVGDYAVLDDPRITTNPALKGQIVGRVSKISAGNDSTFAEVELTPTVDFASLTDVMVAVK